MRRPTAEPLEAPRMARSSFDPSRYKWREVTGDPELSYLVRHDYTANFFMRGGTEFFRNADCAVVADQRAHGPILDAVAGGGHRIEGCGAVRPALL